MNVKKIIIFCIISFFCGVILTGSITIYIYYNISISDSKKYAEQLKQRDDIIAGLKGDNNKSDTIIGDITDTNNRIKTGNTNGLDIIRQIEQCQQQIGWGLQSGSTKK